MISFRYSIFLFPLPHPPSLPKNMKKEKAEKNGVHGGRKDCRVGGLAGWLGHCLGLVEKADGVNISQT